MTKTSVTIIDYNAGNIKSVANALERLGVSYEITSDPKKVARAQRVIFPGVGSARAAMEELRQHGLVDAMRNLKAPFLGICLGMQLLFGYSEEGETECFGIIRGVVKKFRGKGLRVPQMGYNQMQKSKIKNQNDKSKCKNILDAIPNNSYFYFVHSYYCVPKDSGVVAATTEYGVEFASAVQYKNFYGAQFHPEKSGETGLMILQNFCRLQQ